jgi:hypothetical protein
MTTAPARTRCRSWVAFIGLALVPVVSITGCSHQLKPIDYDKVSSGWMRAVQDRWSVQPGELGSGGGSNDASSRLSLGGADRGERAHIRVSVACQGHGTIPMAVWSGRFVNGSETGRKLAARSVQCGHDEDLYVVTSSSWITIGPTSGDSSVTWYAAAYSDLVAKAQEEEK